MRVGEFFGDIYDFETKGNNVRFYLKNDYFKFKTKVGIRNYYYDIDWIVVSPSFDDTSDNKREDLNNRLIPCVIVIKGELARKHYLDCTYEYWLDFIKNNGNGESYEYIDLEAFYIGDHLINGDTLETKDIGATF